MNAITAPSFEVRIEARPILAAVRVLTLTWLGDFLFWRSAPGVSIGIFAAIIGALLLSERAETQAMKYEVMIRAVLLLLACVQLAIEISFTNIVVIAVLLLTFAGDALYPWMTGCFS